MKTWIKRTLIATVSAGALVAGVAYSQGGSHHFGRHGQMSEADMAQMRERMTDRISKELSLDATQKQYLVALGTQMEAQRKRLDAEAAARRAKEELEARLKKQEEDV